MTTQKNSKGAGKVAKPSEVLAFWFKGRGFKDWFFSKEPGFDAEVRKKFLATYEAVVRGETADWRKTAKGRLAEIIVLDQFSRNMFRGTPDMYRYDALALALAQEAIRAGADKGLSNDECMFMYLPFEHSESRVIQKQSVKLFKQIWSKEDMKYAIDHQQIVERFGRFPHRNAILGRTSTAAEKKFMETHMGY
jgi:uncharacterized protein (DUF924 family)